MTLDSFILQIGDRASASLFHVSERTVASWRRGERFPRSEKAKQIAEITSGKVSFADCYERSSVGA